MGLTEDEFDCCGVCDRGGVKRAVSNIAVSICRGQRRAIENPRPIREPLKFLEMRGDPFAARLARVPITHRWSSVASAQAGGAGSRIQCVGG